MKENMPINRVRQNWSQNVIDNVTNTRSFAMNQNHLHLHVNVTNASDFKTIEKPTHQSTFSGADRGDFSLSQLQVLKSNKLKNFSKDKIKIKKRKVEYTPLTINGILKDHAQARLRHKSKDMGF
jgi:hypothetical protein